MIFKIGPQLFEEHDSRHVSELICKIVENRHYIECANKRVYQKIIQAVSNHASTIQYELFCQYDRFTIDQFHKKFYTTIETNDFSYQQLIVLTGKSSILLPENTLEWPIYVHIIETYKNDWHVREVACVLSDLVSAKILTCAQIGGFGEFKNQIPFLQSQCFDGLLQYKCCIITDRDVDADTDEHGNWCWPNSRNWLFELLTSKPMLDITKEDVYCIFQPHYHWHMWYKRAIENYFPDKSFIQLGYDMSEFQSSHLERDYRPSNLIKHYKKENIKKLTFPIGLKDYEHNLKKFYINDQCYSEIELLLLKIMRIV